MVTNVTVDVPTAPANTGTATTVAVTNPPSSNVDLLWATTFLPWLWIVMGAEGKKTIYFPVKRMVRY